MDRRTSLKWMLAAAAASPLWNHAATPAPPAAAGYGTDPDLVKSYRAGDLWPLTLTPAQLETAAALCATIIPPDARSPSAAQLGVHHFIDEWVSAPYPRHADDRMLVLEGLAWIEAEAKRRFGKRFAAGSETGRATICDAICDEAKASPRNRKAARFFARFRDLTADGFYTTPEGMKDLGFAGNVPSETFAGPPREALEKAGVA